MNTLEEHLPASIGCEFPRGIRNDRGVSPCGYDPRPLDDAASTDDEHEREVRAGTSQSDHS
jgi:hypothetical protein